MYKFLQMEQDILKSFQKQFPYLEVAIKASINLVQRVEREFTGVGAFASFYYENTEVLGNKTLAGKRYNSVIIKSKELEHDCPVDIIFGKNGLIDYIELSMGLKEQKYPNEYEICYNEPCIIIDGDDHTR